MTVSQDVGVNPPTCAQVSGFGDDSCANGGTASDGNIAGDSNQTEQGIGVQDVGVNPPTCAQISLFGDNRCANGADTTPPIGGQPPSDQPGDEPPIGGQPPSDQPGDEPPIGGQPPSDQPGDGPPIGGQSPSDGDTQLPLADVTIETAGSSDLTVVIVGAPHDVQGVRLHPVASEPVVERVALVEPLAPAAAGEIAGARFAPVAPSAEAVPEAVSEDAPVVAGVQVRPSGASSMGLTQAREATIDLLPARLPSAGAPDLFLMVRLLLVLVGLGLGGAGLYLRRLGGRRS